MVFEPRYDPLPLEGQHIRLMHLLLGESGDAISCNLHLANLEALEEQVIAVSCTWGPAKPQKWILLDGEVFSVREAHSQYRRQSIRLRRLDSDFQDMCTQHMLAHARLPRALKLFSTVS